MALLPAGALGASNASPGQAAHAATPDTKPGRVSSAGNPLAKERFAEARRLMGEGAAEKAIAAVQEGLKLDPRSTEGLNLLGIIYDQQKDYAQSLAAFRRALEIDPRSTETRNNLGLSYFTQKKLDLAKQEFQASLRIDPRDRTANYNLGLMRLGEGKPKDAIAYLRRVNPPDASVSINLVQAYLRAGEAAEAMKLVHSVSAQAPSDVRLHFSLGVMLAADKQYAPAVHELELADALQPGTIEILHDLGQVYLEDHQPEKAQQVLQRAAKLAPGSAETLYLLGRAYADQRNNVQALEVLLRARKIAPQNTDIIFLMARLSMIQSFYEDAIQLLEEGVKIAPQRPDLRAALGESYFTAGQIDKAKEQFQTLLELDPSAPSYVFMGLCYRHLGRFDEAKKYFNLGLEKDPRNAACLYNLGFIANKQGDQAAAETFLEAALHTNPDYDD
ncbi:MAG TPA: tetratricopeptide repeat protein, partial [Terriglobia bacterium]|nr:tetratricopeptide repeat protein [Terriglobia bacterium]